MNVAADLASLVAALEAEGLPSMLVGGLALDALGVPRATFDVDLQVALPTKLPRGSSVAFGFIVEEWTRDPVFGQDALIVHAPTSGVPFEISFASHWLPRRALAARVRRRRTPSISSRWRAPTGSTAPTSRKGRRASGLGSDSRRSSEHCSSRAPQR